MSRPAPFSSTSAFGVLDVDSGEDTDDEVLEEAPTESVVGELEPAKPSKAAQKRAAKEAKLQQQAEKRQQRLAATSAAVDAHTASPQPESAPAAPAAQPASSVPVEVPGEPQSLRPTPAWTAIPALSLNGHVAPAPLSPKALRKRSIEAISPAPLSPRKRRASQDTPGRPPLPKEAKIELAMHSPAGAVTASVPVEVAISNASTVKQDERAKKMRDAGIRTLWTFIMIGGFLTLLLMGHVYMIMLVMVCQSVAYREVTALFSLGIKDKNGAPEPVSDQPADQRGRRWSKTLNWYFFAVTNYFLYGETIIYYFKHIVFSDANFLPFAMSHRLVSFMLWTMGFMAFVASLKKQYLRQQFGLFCWVHMTLLVIVVSSHFIVNNILEGMIWFWVPASLVICNDIFAYVWGVTMGRTPLFRLSPKKTVEGFVGAFFTTMIFSIWWGTFFMSFDYMICPAHDLGVSAWSSVKCDPNPMWPPLRAIASSLFGRTVTHIPYAPYQFHALALAIFASLVAPFGGFFASGFKRAFDIKDFGHSIPGHGGMTDRMDCQFLMGMFSYVWYSSLVRTMHVTVGSVLQTVVSGLSPQEQVELFNDLKRYLETSGLLS
ncbi:cytidylyltransferase family-domain-containing protein [Auriculariales sp. MPI-PUGE-AT-0066]|nr:cytidylyltransferase family-domain-containing protein [Auriculariales sp. MPI-PUGE-AT-0066]